MINHHTTWEKSLSKGKIGEELFLKWLQEDLWEWGWEDVRSDPEYRRKDIDFIVCGDEAYTVDVKASYRSDGIIVIEEQSVVGSKPGWIYTSEADFFVFINIENGEMVWLQNDEDLQGWWESNKHAYNEMFNSTDQGRWKSSYRKIPLADLPQNQYEIRKFSSVLD